VSVPTYTRRALAFGAFGLTAAVAGGALRARDLEPARRLELLNVHSGERASVEFGADDSAPGSSGLTPQSLAQLRHVLRDYRSGQEHEMDVRLFVLLRDLANAAGVAPKYEVISGYRSAATNAKLRADGHAVAEHSLHMEGRAIDVRLESYSLERLRDLALAARRGGVGYYPRSDFVHIDTGRVRSWGE